MVSKKNKTQKLSKHKVKNKKIKKITIFTHSNLNSDELDVIILSETINELMYQNNNVTLLTTTPEIKSKHTFTDNLKYNNYDILRNPNKKKAILELELK